MKPWTYKPREVYGFQRKHSTPTEHFTLTAEVDWSKLLRDLGHKAAFNKTGVSRALNGAVKVRAKRLVRKDTA